jgi:hypothetical protein
MVSRFVGILSKSAKLPPNANCMSTLFGVVGGEGKHSYPGLEDGDNEDRVDRGVGGESDA